MPDEKGILSDDYRRLHAAALAEGLAAAGHPASGVGRPATDVSRRPARDHQRRAGPITAQADRQLVCVRREPRRADRAALGTRVAGVELVAWRDQDNRLRVGPRSCPHLGADLATAAVHRGNLICRWHGLCLNGDTEESGWKPLPSHDDGVLAWVRLDTVGGEAPLDEPVIAARPADHTLCAVTRLVGACEPTDIIANRLDPWHGAWFHPYSFTRLDVLTTPTEETDRFLVAVTFRVGRIGVPTVAEFSSPEARTIVMRIVDGEGTGSVVETHATPIGLDPDNRPRTAVIEAVIAHSERTGFKRARRAAPLISGLMRFAASRLWRDDIAYAERLYQLRSGPTS